MDNLELSDQKVCHMRLVLHDITNISQHGDVQIVQYRNTYITCSAMVDIGFKCSYRRGITETLTKQLSLCKLYE